MKRLTFILVILLTAVVSTQAVVPGEPDYTILWNNFNAVSMVDGFAVTSSPNGLAVFAPDSVTGYYRQVAQHFLPTEPLAHKRYDSVLAVRTEADLIYFVDLNDLPQISILGYADLAGPFADFAVVDQHLYVAMEFEGLWRYRLTDYNNAQFVDSSMLGIHYTQVDAFGQELLALDDYNGVLRYDIRSDGFAEFRDYLFIPFRATAFRRADSLLLVTLSDARLLVSDLSAQLPTIIDTIPLLFPAARIFANDSLAAVLNSSAPTMEVFTLSDRSPSVRQLAITPSSTLNGDVFADTSLLMLPTSGGGLASYNMATGLADPVGRSVLERPGPIEDVVVRDEGIYTGGVQNPLELYSLKSDTALTRDTTFYPGLRGVGAIAFNGDTMLVMYQSLARIFMIDLTNDTLPFLGSASPGLTGIKELVMTNRPVDTLAAFFAVGGNGVELFSISDSAGISSQGILYSIDGVTGAAYLDSLLFVASPKTGVRIYRLYNDFSVEYRTSISFGVQPSHITVHDGRLFAFAGRDLQIFSVTNPLTPLLDTTVHLPRGVTDVSIDGSLMYTTGPEGILVFDLGGGYPQLIDEGGRAGRIISVRNGIAALSDGNSLDVYRLLGTPTGIEDEELLLPVAARLEQNYPNPFNPSTTIRFSLMAQSQVQLTVHNVLGQTVDVLVDDRRPAGDYEIVWDGRNASGTTVASGVYFYRLVTPGAVESRKMILMK